MQDSSRPDTRNALISAAKRLFAEKGLGGVSARDIMREAGARNQSALQYHFGGMEGLMQEIFAHRYREVEKTRLANLEKLEESGSHTSIEAVMAAAIRPLYEACLEEDGRFFALFSVQLSTDPRFNLTELIDDIGMSSVSRIGEMLFACLDDLPDETRRVRLRQVYTVSAVLVADYAREVEAGTASPVEQATREAAASLAGFLKTMPS